MSKINMTPSERQIDRIRNNAYFMLSGALAAISSPGMTADEIDHAIESLDMVKKKMESYLEAVEDEEDSEGAEVIG